ncbi:MAG: antibiotic biosynthesis monooxygenase [Acidimicrobiia bacterium]|nr:antibiotic biosynthesis monooxygenase [Acidimicrobiia bacterium]
MSVVRINAIEAPDGKGQVLEERFAQRAGAVDQAPGFEGFELLRPTDDSTTYYVYTRWASEEDFNNWRESEGFGKGHTQHQEQGPVGTGSSLLSFDVVKL